MRRRRLLAACLATVTVGPTLASAQAFIYPARGQSPQQEQFDKGQCYTWAVQQSGFDPANTNLILQGGQGGRGWTMTISEATGSMSAAITAEGEGFIVFGACAVLP